MVNAEGTATISSFRIIQSSLQLYILTLIVVQPRIGQLYRTFDSNNTTPTSEVNPLEKLHQRNSFTVMDPGCTLLFQEGWQLN